MRSRRDVRATDEGVCAAIAGLMPEGFEYHEADILNSTGFRVTAGDKLTFNYDGYHGSIAPFEYRQRLSRGRPASTRR